MQLVATEEKPFVVITTSYNNKDWYQQNLDSIFSQKYANWRLIYIDDCSADGTPDLVQEHCIQNKKTEQVTLIRNVQRNGHLANQYHAIHSCKPEEIIIICDGDDWLAHEEVFSHINTFYQNDIWITYGQFWYWKKNKKGLCKAFPLDDLKNGNIRTFSWRTSHLRTFYAGLFQKIKFEDLLFEGKFFPLCADVSTMLPMIEMAREHTQFIPDILYIYNDGNPLSFHHNPEKQRAVETFIKQKPPYKKLEIPPYYPINSEVS